MSKRRAVSDAEMEAADAQRMAANRFNEAICGLCGEPRNMHVEIATAASAPAWMAPTVWICPRSTFLEK